MATLDERVPHPPDTPPVVWRFAASEAQLAQWERASELEAVAVDYQVAGAPPESWWRVQVVTQAWLQARLSAPYTAHAHPALLIIPDGSLADRRAAITRLLSPGSAVDLTRVAEPVMRTMESRNDVAEHPPQATA